MLVGIFETTMDPLPVGTGSSSPAAVIKSGYSSGSDVSGIVYVVRAVLRLLYVLANNVYCIPTYALWVLLLKPAVNFNVALFWWVEGAVFKALLLMVASWGWTAGYRYYEVGEDVSSCYDDECLVLANHQSTADVPSLMAAFQSKGRVVADMMWIMDYLFKYTNFGLVSWIHGDFFIHSGKNTRTAELDRLANHMDTVYVTRRRKWIVLFPEGGFLKKRRETSLRYSKKNNLPLLEYVTLPRVGAMHTIVNTLHPSVKPTSDTAVANDAHGDRLGSSISEETKTTTSLKWIVDITIGYPGGVPVTLESIVCMLDESRDIYLHYRRFPIEEVPLDEAGLTSWLYARFQEKEILLREFYRTGSFPVLPNANVDRLLDKPQPIEFDSAYIAAVNILFIVSTLFHWWIITWLCALLWPF